MEFGLFMMPLHPPHRSIADSYDRDLDLIVKADQLGYNEAWIGEHITERWENAPSPELLIAKALAMTERIILATGVTLLIGFQAFINMGVAVGLLPTKGLTLPFISMGGSSMVVSMMCIGVLLNISDQKVRSL